MGGGSKSTFPFRNCGGKDGGDQAEMIQHRQHEQGKIEGRIKRALVETDIYFLLFRCVACGETMLALASSGG